MHILQRNREIKMTADSKTPRNEPQCLDGSFSSPGCAATRLKAEIAELKRELSALRASTTEMPEEPEFITRLRGIKCGMLVAQATIEYIDLLRSQLAAVMVEKKQADAKLSAAYAAVKDAAFERNWDREGYYDWLEKHAATIAAGGEEKP